MPWTPALTQLRDSLAELYPDESSARRIAAEAGLALSRIALQGSAINIWHGILEEAQKQGQVGAVLRVALGDYPNNLGLRAAAKAYGVAVEALPNAVASPTGQPHSDVRTGTEPVDRGALLGILTQRLSSSELRTLCFDLQVDYEDLAGETKPDKARELIQYLERRGRLPELVPHLRGLRPDIDLRIVLAGYTVTVAGPQPPLTGSQSREEAKTAILFLASEPTDAARLRLGEEFREIQEKLQLSRWRDRFDLQVRLSVRPPDITQALLDIQPQVVHFAGHGEGDESAAGRALKLVSAQGAPVANQGAAEGGGLYFEDAYSQAQLVPAEALAALFEQFAGQVRCVVLNACYSEGQARAIARHIPHVIGMRRAIGDRAAIAFSIGFYQALGAGRSVEQAYRLGCVQIGLQGIPEHLTPVLIKKGEKSRG